MKNLEHTQPFVADDLYLNDAMPIDCSDNLKHWLKPSEIIDIFGKCCE